MCWLGQQNLAGRHEQVRLQPALPSHAAAASTHKTTLLPRPRRRYTAANASPIDAAMELKHYLHLGTDRVLPPGAPMQTAPADWTPQESTGDERRYSNLLLALNFFQTAPG